MSSDNQNFSANDINDANALQAGPEDDFATHFRTAALAITNMYKKSMQLQGARYYDGYEQCLMDLAQFLSSSSSARNEGPSLDELYRFIKEKHRMNSTHRRINSMDPTMGVNTSHVQQQNPSPSASFSQQQRHGASSAQTSNTPKPSFSFDKIPDVHDDTRKRSRHE